MACDRRKIDLEETIETTRYLGYQSGLAQREVKIWAPIKDGYSDTLVNMIFDRRTRVLAGIE